MPVIQILFVPLHRSRMMQEHRHEAKYTYVMKHYIYIHYNKVWHPTRTATKRYDL